MRDGQIKLVELLLLISVASCLLLVRSNAYEIQNCSKFNETIGVLRLVELENCPLSGEFCPLVKGKNASIRIDFETLVPFETAEVHVYGNMYGMVLPFVLEPKEACGNYGLKCPVKAHELKQLRITLPVQRFYPKVSVEIQVNLIDDQSRNVFCVKFPAKIVNDE